ncbi:MULTISPECIES: MerR family transcriptional regulator [unclassified Halanaerobium]|uniref:MerR family transcriptional regulator n=1 Tax=unclassified Halanaerobium TaxID=2641197 RepID=UPI000DF4C80A|nr:MULTISPECIES: MerR family transcriptional regulator [unclassified Halanaerobium]RCW49962.1 MerR family glutamine synthetase transcriptional repressor [Halanaerobium sp. MA284_MarDTE_T2]RCW81103.1 MerR family glutamine synthetase transcriptional repressor [Halanaerobium sp. DL-01]
MDNEKTITMKEAKERTGLSSRQIRYYDEQNLIFPGRTKGNQRIFSENDIQRMLKIKEFISAGYNIERIREKLNPPSFEELIPDDLDIDTADLKNRFNEDKLDSLFPVSNRSALIKKLSISKNQNKSHGEEKENV